MEKIRIKKVLIAMSGGVDSSVAAYLLKKGGYEAVGVFLRLADLDNFREAEKQARKTAKILGIDFLVLDLRKEFKKTIIDYFIKEYRAGRTPNPCILCNKKIKFEYLLREAKKRKYDYVATGHYARKREFKTKISNLKNKNYNLKFKLLKGKDESKDQSYFLYRLTQRNLGKIIFPLGNYKKEEVKALAKKLGLPAAKAKESQEVCFIKDANLNEFLKMRINANKGSIVDTKGNVLGRHNGLPFYTIGQRKGIGLSGGPYYVIGKNLKRNEVIVSKDEKDLLKKECIVKNINWISEPEKFPAKVFAKIRYRSKAASAIIRKLDANCYKLTFASFQRAITPGQSAVFYLPAEALAKAGEGNELLGGGIILFQKLFWRR